MPAPRPPYSVPFINYSEATGASSFNVPVGNVAVIRQFSVVTTLGVSAFTLNIQDSSIAPFIAVAAVVTEAVLADAQREGRWVVPGGGTIDIFQQTLGVGAYAYVGGYLLADAS